MPPFASSVQLESINSIDLKALRGWMIKGITMDDVIRWVCGGETVGAVAYEFAIETQKGTYFRLKYTSTDRNTGEKQYMDYEVPLVSTECNYGGKRWWFACPRCLRRCRILYADGLYYVCRKCTGCWYNSQSWYDQKFRWLANHWKADYYYEDHVKRERYRGEFTRKYKSYLKMRGG